MTIVSTAMIASSSVASSRAAATLSWEFANASAIGSPFLQLDDRGHFHAEIEIELGQDRPPLW